MIINSRLLEIYHELRIPGIADMYASDKRLTDYGDEVAEDIIDCIIMRMADLAGGMNHFWKKEDAKIQMKAWVNALKYFTTKQVFHAGFQVMTGKVDKIPKSPIDFMQIVNNGIHNRLAPGVEETQNRINSSHRLEFDVDAARRRAIDARNRCMPKVKEELKALGVKHKFKEDEEDLI